MSAFRSVPAALYAFLASASSQNEIDLSENGFEKTLKIAMMFGGDSDTICSMAGAIAGAFYGESAIPDYMKQICEGYDNAIRQADRLHKIIGC